VKATVKKPQALKWTSDAVHNIHRDFSLALQRIVIEKTAIRGEGNNEVNGGESERVIGQSGIMQSTDTLQSQWKGATHLQSTHHSGKMKKKATFGSHKIASGANRSKKARGN